jgi:hypothetical protein
MTGKPKTGTCAAVCVQARECSSIVRVTPTGLGVTVVIESSASPKWQLIDIAFEEWDALVKCVETVRKANK